MDKAAGRTSQRDCCTGHHIHSWPANCCEKCGGPEAPLAFFSSPASMARWPSTSCTRARKRSRWLQKNKRGQTAINAERCLQLGPEAAALAAWHKQT